MAVQRYSILADGYTGRHLAQSEHVDQVQPQGRGCFLRQFPVTALLSVTDARDAPIDHSAVHLDGDTGAIDHGSAWNGKRLTIVYEAGYSRAPDDLALAICTLAHGFLSGTHGGTEAIAPVRRETVYGVSSVDYALPKDAESYPEIGAFRAVFDRYRRSGMA
jgi:hypothetical protein